MNREPHHQSREGRRRDHDRREVVRAEGHRFRVEGFEEDLDAEMESDRHNAAQHPADDTQNQEALARTEPRPHQVR